MIALAAFFASGCGLMFHGSKQTVDFKITPREAAMNAKIFVDEEDIKGKSITLERKNSYRYRVESPGFEPLRGEVKNKPDAVALILNIVGNWGIGILIDAAADSIHNLEPDPIELRMRPIEGSTDYLASETKGKSEIRLDPYVVKKSPDDSQSSQIGQYEPMKPAADPAEQPIVRQTAMAEQGERWALVVGIGQYEDREIPPIPHAAEDARAVRDFLVSTRGGGYKADHVFLLTDYDATSRKLKQYLEGELKKKVQREDDLLIYFACHGMVVPSPRAGSEDGLEKYLIPYDTVSDDVTIDGLSIADLETTLDAIECRQVAMVMDTCFSGGARSFARGPATRNTTISSSFLKDLAKQKGMKHRKVLTACSADELAQDDPDTGHGIFTTYFLDSLENAEDMDGNGWITLYEVYRRLDRKVRERSAEIGQRQHPQWVGDPAYPFPVRRIAP